MFKWFLNKRIEKIERWKVEAKNRNARYLTVVFNSVDKFEYPVFDVLSTSVIGAALKAAPYNSLKYAVDGFSFWEPKKKI